MRPKSPGPVSWPGVGSCILLLMGTVCAADVRARCGEYVHPPRTAGAVRNAASAQRDQEPAAPSPCHGPSCSRGQAPVVPITPDASPVTDTWACLPGVPRTTRDVPALLLAPCTAVVPTGRVADIFHPPRS